MLTAKTSFWARIPFLGNLGLPIAEKEVRSLLRRNRYFWVQFFYLAIITAGVAILVAGSHGQGVSPEVISRRLFTLFFAVQNVLVYLIFPAFAATAISGERVEKSFDLLITTDLRPVEIVWGKFLGIFGNCCYFFLVTLPILATCILFGGVSIGQALENYLLLLIQAGVLTIFGIFVSSASASNLRAIIGTYVVAFAVGFVVTSGLSAIATARGFQLSPSDMVLRQLPPPLGWITLISTAGVAVLLFAFCFVGAVQRLTSPEGNRSTPIRILALITGAGALTLVAVLHHELTLGGELRRAQDHMYFLLSCSGILGVLALLALPVFASERVVTPLRVARFAQRKPWAGLCSWILLPGGVRGFAFSATIALSLWLTLGLMADGVGVLDGLTVGGATGDALEVVLTTWRIGLVALLCYCALAMLFSSVGISGFLNWALVAGLAILVNLFPLIFVVGQRPQSFLHFYELSPLVVLVHYWGGTGVADDPAPLIANVTHAFWAHVGLTCFFGILAVILMRRRGVAAFRPWRPGTVGGSTP